MNNGLYFVRVNGGERIEVARKDGNLLYRDTFTKETSDLEIIEKVPIDVVYAEIKGTKILNMAKVMGLFNSRQRD